MRLFLLESQGLLRDKIFAFAKCNFSLRIKKAKNNSTTTYRRLPQCGFGG